MRLSVRVSWPAGAGLGWAPLASRRNAPLHACPSPYPHSSPVIIPTLSPTASCIGETASTLKFASRAKQVRNRPVANEDVSQSAVDMAAELQVNAAAG